MSTYQSKAPATGYAGRGNQTAAPASGSYADKPKAVKTHGLSFRKKGAQREEKGFSITGFFQDEGKNFSTVSVSQKILDTLKDVQIGDKLYLFTEAGK